MEILPELNSLTSKVNEIARGIKGEEKDLLQSKLTDQFNGLFRTAFDQGLIM